MRVVAPNRTILVITVALASSIALTFLSVGLARFIALEDVERSSPLPLLREGWGPQNQQNHVHDVGRSSVEGRDPDPVPHARPGDEEWEYPSSVAGATQALPANTNSDPSTNVRRHPNVERMLTFQTGRFGAGFRNSAMAFTWLVMYAAANNYTSIKLESLAWEDLFGKGVHPWAFVPHSQLFDVRHWNEHYYPQLPRLLSINDTVASSTHVDAYGYYWMGAYEQYANYSKLVASDPRRYPKSPVEIAMLKGAFRPSRELRDYMDRLTYGKPYAALHARVEPDMQGHLYCTDLKVVKLSDVVRIVETHLPRPDFDRLFIATNRILLEDEVLNENPDNEIAADNLRELNRIRDNGMWNGSVEVFEAGASYLRDNGKDGVGSYFGIAGAVLDYFLALQSTTFIGTEVSSFSTDIIQSRFYRSEFRNYHYRPDGLYIATTQSDTLPPSFAC